MNAHSLVCDANSQTRRGYFINWLPLESEKTVFVVVSLLDVLLTILLLRTGSFYETNPMADFFISGWGFMGMLAFKLILVAMVLSVVNIIAIWRHKVARSVLNFGSILTATVVIYSTVLLTQFYLK